MERQYDLFQIDRGKSIWQFQAIGGVQAGVKLRELSDGTPKECLAVHLATMDVLARLNVGSVNADSELIFLLGYDSKFALALSQELIFHGYRFGFAATNEVGCAILSTPMPCGIFIVGYAAIEESRREMAAWLKRRYPAVPIIALNSPGLKLDGADYNLELDSNDALLPMIAEALGAEGSSGSAMPD